MDSVDVLLVIDDSASIAARAAQLKEQLPCMMEALTTGSDGDTSFPPAKSVHVAVTTTNMGVGDSQQFLGCDATGRDGVFVRPGEVGVTCQVSYPGYLSYEGAAAPVSVVESAACVPLVFGTGDATTQIGCGFEQPLEAALKALWPSDDHSVSFLTGSGHGSDANAGFLRDTSLLVVVVVTDEDDCSAQDQKLFAPGYLYPDEDLGRVNLRCYNHANALYGVQRYVDHLKHLRPNNDNVIFAVVAGVPAHLVSDEVRAQYDFDEASDVQRYYDTVLADPLMQQWPSSNQDPAHLLPSCEQSADGQPSNAAPPRRLVEVAVALVRTACSAACASPISAAPWAG